MNILVLDGNQNQAVACVRSLARAGHTVYVGESASWSKAGWSRACSGEFRYPAPRQHLDAFVDAVANFVRKRPDTLVLPMTEATTLPLSIHRTFLISAGARLILPNHEDLCRAFDKAQSTLLACRLGVPVPKTTLTTTIEEARAAAQSNGFPLVLKPYASEQLSEGKLRQGGRPRYVQDIERLQSTYDDVRRSSSAVLLQEFVPGHGTGYFALMNHGELRAEFAHTRVRDLYPSGSGSAVRVSIHPTEQVRRFSLAILSALHWHGAAMVEFREHRDGVVFMEVNGRLWHSLALACYAGVDFPLLLARMTEAGDAPSDSAYLDGVRCRWILGDLHHLVEVWKGPPLGYPGKYPGRLRTLLEVLTPVAGTRHDLFQWRDPLPELADWVGVLKYLSAKKSIN
jgi:predicted ATP-grasp superfamily ATP-dependent carboligase